MLDGEKIKYTITEDKAWIEQQYSQNHTANVTVQFTDTFGNYYGIGEAEETIIVPPMEEEPEQIDWFFLVGYCRFYRCHNDNILHLA